MKSQILGAAALALIPFTSPAAQTTDEPAQTEQRPRAPQLKREPPYEVKCVARVLTGLGYNVTQQDERSLKADRQLDNTKLRLNYEITDMPGKMIPDVPEEGKTDPAQKSDPQKEEPESKVFQQGMWMSLSADDGINSIDVGTDGDITIYGGSDDTRPGYSELSQVFSRNSTNVIHTIRRACALQN